MPNHEFFAIPNLSPNFAKLYCAYKTANCKQIMGLVENAGKRASG